VDIPFRKRLSTRFGILIVLIVVGLAGATAMLVARGFDRISDNAAPQLEQLEQLGVEPVTDLDSIIRSTAVNLIAVFLLTLVAATLFSRSLLTEPISSLVKATQDIASGQLGVTLPVNTQDELGLLASSFNTMSKNLAARTDELLKVNEALRESETRLEQRVQERTSELLALLELSNSIALTLDDIPLIEEILDELQDIADYGAAGVFRLLGTQTLESVVSKNSFTDLSEADMLEVVASKQRRKLHREGFTQLIFPLIVRDKAVGTLLLEFSGAAPISEPKLQLITAFANQAGVALENITLYQQVQETAALEERQHLARELHDSVSQALYSIVLGTHAAQKQLERDPDKASQALEYVQNLAEAGLAEMRALIFELRPEVLEQEGLAAALRKQVEALEVRHEVRAEFVTDDGLKPFTLPFATKQALYRIVQEALHNVVKHARAENVQVRLNSQGNYVVLTIKDDGNGFDTQQEFPGHLGLKSMRERSLSLGGTFSVESAPEQGTIISVKVPKRV